MALKTLAEHDAEREAAYEGQRAVSRAARQTGIACPACGAELLDHWPRQMLQGTQPPQQRVECETCGWLGWRNT